MFKASERQLRFQDDLDHLSEWSVDSMLVANAHLSRKSLTFLSTYSANGITTPSINSHRDLGSNTLDWTLHYNAICCKAYKLLGLIHHTFSSSCTVAAKRSLDYSSDFIPCLKLS